MVFKIKKMPLNALNLIYCQFIRIIIEDIVYIIKEALEVFSSVYKQEGPEGPGSLT